VWYSMDITHKGIFELLKKVAQGILTPHEAYEALRDIPFEDLKHSKIDYHRTIRKGLQEVIFGEGKTLKQIGDIIKAMQEKKMDVLATRINPETGKQLAKKFPSGTYDREARCFYIQKDKTVRGKGTILIMSAGTGDVPVAEEAYRTSIFFGNRTEKLYDVGVSGIHRVVQNLPVIRKARVIVVVAGMEGALPSIIAGIVGVPVIGVPTSIGYGVSFHGVSALLTMLNSCSTVSVFNIDNGFGAAYFATLINRL